MTAARRTRSWWLVPLVAVAATQALGLLVAVAVSANPVTDGLKWDALRYLDIAERGYELYPCPPGPIPYPLRPPDAWCGNAHWFPLYPLLIRGLHEVGLPYGAAGWLLSALALFAAFALLWRLLGGRLTAVAAQCLALAAALPGSTYFPLIFPVSLALLAVVGLVTALRARAWAWAGAAAALGAATYPSTGILVAIAPVAILLGFRHLSWAGRIWRAAGAGAIGAAAVVAVLATFQLTTGRWDAYLLIERNYGEGVHWPWATLWQVATSGRLLDTAYLLSTLVILAVVVPAVVAGVRQGRRDGFDAPLWALLAMAAGFVLVPLVLGPAVAPHRSYALLGAVVLLLVAVPERLRLILIAVSTGITVVLTGLFYAGVLI
ncbi:hypothetical protein GCM10009682_13540 [Luedemannella flava]|uniref:Glycosyltransferase RgtA/B/C/D-like domain-containing protein n=2 Tax=Luedemannella flava TaxID=349316 RepID=A0ABP4XUW8_9ACTN